MTKLSETGFHEYKIPNSGGTLASFLKLILNYPTPEQELSEYDYYSGEDCVDEDSGDYSLYLMQAAEVACNKAIPVLFVSKPEVAISSPIELKTWGGLIELLCGDCILIEAHHQHTKQAFGDETALWKVGAGRVHDLEQALSKSESHSSIPPQLGESAIEILRARTS